MRGRAGGDYGAAAPANPRERGAGHIRACISAGRGESHAGGGAPRTVTGDSIPSQIARVSLGESDYERLWNGCCPVKLRRLCWQVHGHQNLLGDGFALDQGDQAQRSLAFLADGLDPENPA